VVQTQPSPNLMYAIFNKKDSFHWVSILYYLFLTCSHFLFICSQPSLNLLPSSNLSVPNPLPISFQHAPNLHPTCFNPVLSLHPTSSKPTLLATFSEQGPNMLRVHKFKLIYSPRSLTIFYWIFQGVSVRCEGGGTFFFNF
jgi:hypothetical protein